MKTIPLTTIPLTKGKIAIVDDDVYGHLIKFKWRADYHHRNWYAFRIAQRYHKYLCRILMHRVIIGIPPPGFTIDHIDGNGLNNQRENLRFIKHAQNQYRQKPQRNTSSKYKGVCWGKNQNKWLAYIKFNQKRIGLGVFHNEIDAALAYDVAAKKYFGEHANLNLL